MKISKDKYNGRDASVPAGAQGYPLEMKYVLVPVTLTEKTLFQKIFKDPLPDDLLRLVNHDEYSDHCVRYSVNEKWNDINDKLSQSRIEGTKDHTKQYTTMYTYARNFLAMTNWIICTDHLPQDICYSKNNYGVGKTDSFHYLKPRAKNEGGFKIFNDRLFQTITDYCLDKGIRNFLGNEDKITHDLNVGYAIEMAKKNQNNPCHRTEVDAVLVVGLADFCSQFSVSRVNRSKQYTISPQIPKVGLCNARLSNGHQLLKRNVSLKWDSDILFPVLEKKFKNVKSFKHVFLDHIVSPGEES